MRLRDADQGDFFRAPLRATRGGVHFPPDALKVLSNGWFRGHCCSSKS
jgi:hypothetical protein